ncbi:hypothetical protein Taro_040764 [Colocasia esculenta]|uniref:Uncharacterized protein n=1 Tax=Colocasia esculenta TaxID=4460 RepID=A0A843WJU9_COLES|nr:hypothetical protein [Colocasia esculenta]
MQGKKGFIKASPHLRGSFSSPPLPLHLLASSCECCLSSGCCGEIVAVRELLLLLFQVKVLQAVAERSCCVVPGYHRSSSSGRPLQQKLILQARMAISRKQASTSMIM